MDYTLTNDVTWLPNQGWDERIHIAANGDLVNVFVLVTDRFVILVDTLLNPTATNHLVEFAKPYFASRQLLVINSHSDWDHAWGNQLFAGPHALYPAPIIAHENARTESFHPENLELLQRLRVERPNIFGASAFGEIIITPPTLTFSHDLWIDGGDLTLHLFPTPGHSHDHIAIFIPEISTLLAGDAAELPFPMIESSADFPALRSSLHAMANLQADNALYCHAPPTIGPQLLLDNIAYYDAIEATCRAALSSGFNPDIVATADLPAILHCKFATVAPTTGAWEDVSERARTTHHAQQIRFMLAWLQNKDVEMED
jgi:glyoxylase-like metal-dependent hydrolase (beta-lactamase superfamily II)